MVAQSPQLSNELKAFVKYDQPTIVLTHVRIIDGTGAAAKDDQNLLISNGKIQSITPAASANSRHAMDHRKSVLISTRERAISGFLP